MATRLLSEDLIRRHHPHIRYVRVHTSGRNAVAIYAWNDQLELPESDKARLQRFAAAYMPPYLCCQVKVYSDVRSDGVPTAPEELPEAVMQAAMNRELTPPAVISLMNRMISRGRLVFQRYDEGTGTLHFSLHRGDALSGCERERVQQYLYEVVPVGCLFEVKFE